MVINSSIQLNFAVTDMFFKSFLLFFFYLNVATLKHFIHYLNGNGNLLHLLHCHLREGICVWVSANELLFWGAQKK